MRPVHTAQGWSFHATRQYISSRALAYGGSLLAAAVPRLRAVLPGADPNAGTRDAAIYVAFDKWGLVADYVVDQVAALARAGLSVTFVSNSPRLPPDAAARLAPHVRDILHRRNFGHDFGGYKDAIARLDVSALDSLVLMNDSCYGPFADLAEVNRRAAVSGAGVFGITESWDFRYHLQTYYVWIGGAVLRSAAFARFWQALLPSQPRSLAIQKGEIAFTQTMLKAGFTARALCPYAEAARLAQLAARQRLAESDELLEEEERYLRQLAAAIAAGHTLNPTHAVWDVLVTQCGSPFIKRELLRRNPMGIPGLLGWEGMLPTASGVDMEAIRNHLQRN